MDDATMTRFNEISKYAEGKLKTVKKLNRFALSKDEIMADFNSFLWEVLHSWYDERKSPKNQVIYSKTWRVMIDEYRKLYGRKDSNKNKHYANMKKLNTNIIYNKSNTYDLLDLIENVLNEREYKIIYMYFYDNMTYNEIGEIENLGTSRVGQIINNCLEKLKPYV